MFDEFTLSVALGNNCFDTETLLSLRFVNKTWCDIATKILLNRNACQLKLRLYQIYRSSPTSVSQDKDVNMEYTAHTAIYCNARKPKLLLTELNEIISKSPKFPSTSLKIMNEYAFGSTSYHIDVEPLFKFFSLHGSKLTTLSVGDLISSEDLLDVLLRYTKILNCLDLRSLTVFRNSIAIPYVKQALQSFMFPPRARLCSSLKILRLGVCFNHNDTNYNFNCEPTLSYFIRSAPNLERLENVFLHHLPTIMKLDVCHFIKDLQFIPYRQKSDLAIIKKFLKPKMLKIKLSGLTVDFVNLSGEIMYAFGGIPLMVLRLGGLIQRNNHFLVDLHLHVNPFDFLRKIGIPRLPNLLRLKLTQVSQSFKACNVVDVFGRKDHVSRNYSDKERIFVFYSEKDKNFGDRIFFPKLKRVELDVQDYRVDDKLLAFFTYKTSRDNRGDSIRSVRILEICGSVWPNHSEVKALTDLFPNVKQIIMDSQRI